MKNANGRANGQENYRKRLLAKRTELLSSLHTKLGTLAVPGGGAPEDLAPVFHDQFVVLQINRLNFHQLKQVDAALERMDGEDYGVCTDCEDPISHRRLEAIPWAVRCVACEERLSSACDSGQYAEVAA